MNRYEDTARLLKMMGHPIRLQILDMLRQGETCVCHIERALDKRQAYVSQQLMLLRDARLVDSRKDGLQVYYRLGDDRVVELLNLLAGTPITDGLEVLSGCNCPTCSSIRIPEGQLEGLG